MDPQILRFCSSVAEFLEKYTFSLNTYSKILSQEPAILDLDLAFGKVYFFSEHLFKDSVPGTSYPGSGFSVNCGCLFRGLDK